MSDGLEAQSETPSLEEINAVIAELEQYRERLITETMTTTKKAKLPKSKANALLEPELAQIDTALADLRQRQAELQAIA
jgi:hypothetical protein